MDIKQSRKIILPIFVVICIGSIASAILLKEEDLDERVNATTEDSNTPPSFVNVAPNTAIVGGEYVYVPRVVDSETDSNSLTISVVDAPTWLYLQGRVLRGTPTSSGTYEVTLSVSDGGTIVENSFYIVVSNE